jgi:hypothetical protein
MCGVPPGTWQKPMPVVKLAVPDPTPPTAQLTSAESSKYQEGWKPTGVSVTIASPGISWRTLLLLRCQRPKMPAVTCHTPPSIASALSTVRPPVGLISVTPSVNIVSPDRPT